MQQVELRWRGRARAILVVALAGTAAGGAWYLFDPRSDARLATGMLWALAAIAALLLIQSFRFRLVADERGLRITSLFGNRAAAWSEVTRVDMTAAWSDSRYTYRARTVDPNAAQLVTIVAPRWRQTLHRSLHDIDGFLALVHSTHLMAQAPEPMPPGVPEPLLRAYSVARVIKGVVVFAVSLMFTAGVAAFGLGFPTGSLFTAFFIDVLALLALCAAALWLARHLRARRRARGDATTDLASYPEDAMYGASAAMGGALLLAAFVPRLVTSDGDLSANLGLTALGLWLLWIAVREFRDYVRG